MHNLMRFFRQEEGVTAVEYALIVALIAVAIVSTLSVLGGNMRDTLTDVSDAMANVDTDG